MSIFDQDLTEDQIMMRDVCRRFVDNTIIPFISKNWKTEWDLTPESRLPNSILEDADKSVLEHWQYQRNMDATVDISHFKIVKALWPETAGVYAGPEE